MKNIIFCILSIIVLGACVLSQDTDYATIGGIVFIGLISAATLKEIYVYEKNKKELSGVQFMAKRDGIITKLLGCFLMVIYFNDNFMKVENISFIFISFLIVYVLSNLYISGFQRAIISGEGFLSSSGKFIKMDEVKVIGSKNGFMRNCIKLIVTCEKDQFIFRVKNCDYENIKNLIKIYRHIDFEEN